MRNYNIFDIDKYIESIKEVIDHSEDYLLGEEIFKNNKKVLLNTFISEFNNLLDLALEVASLLADDNDFFNTIDVIKSITYQDIIDYTKKITNDNACVYVVRGNSND